MTHRDGLTESHAGAPRSSAGAAGGPAAPQANPSTGSRRRLPRGVLAGLVVGAVVLIACLIVLPYTVAWYDVQDLGSGVRAAPRVRPVVSWQVYADQLRRVSPPGVSDRLAPIVFRASSWMGHDDLGRSLLFRTVLGVVISLVIAGGAMIVAVGVGTWWGATAALSGGIVDLVMMRVVDVLYGLPYVLMVILMKVALTEPIRVLVGGRTRYADVVILVLAIGSVSWLTVARVVRGQVLALREEPFVHAARAIGAGRLHILWHHMLPNLTGTVLVYASLVIPQAIMQEAFLSFLGIGVQNPLPSLGRLAADGVVAVNPFVASWWMIVFPCGLLATMLVTLNRLADCLHGALGSNRRPR